MDHTHFERRLDQDLVLLEPRAFLATLLALVFLEMRDHAEALPEVIALSSPPQHCWCSNSSLQSICAVLAGTGTHRVSSCVPGLGLG